MIRITAVSMSGWLAGLTILCCPAWGYDSDAVVADAVERRDHERVQELLEQRAAVQVAQADGMTGLHWAVYHDDLPLTRRLLGAGADPRAENRYGVAPLTLACQNGNAAIVKLLLAAGADANTTLRGGETVLMTAARTGRLAPVRALLAAGAVVDAQDREGQTAVMWTAAEGHGRVVDALIQAGADFRQALPSGFTPLFFAVREGRTDVVLQLLDAGIDVGEVMRVRKTPKQGPQDRTSPLMLAIENGHFELAQRLLAAGADPNDDRSGHTPLHAMTWIRKPKRGDGDPPPTGSGALSSLDFVRELVARGADVNARHGRHKPADGHLNYTDATPLLMAAETGDIPLMELLLELGADPRLTNVDQCTPLLAAAGVGVLSNGDESAGTEEEAIAAVQLLLDLGADINAVDDNGNSAMHGAAYKSWTLMVAFLSERGAEVDVWNHKNHKGWTPMTIAEGHRPGNFRPSPETIAAIQRVMDR